MIGRPVKQITFYFDVISPYAWLAFQKLPEALLGLSYGVVYQPVLFGGVLGHHGQLGPAEIAPKRDWTYRQVLWLAQSQRVELQMPANHPFNPLGLLRLAVACGHDGAAPNRCVTESLFRHVWASGGADATDPARLQVLTGQLAPSRDPTGDAVKSQLKANTDDAITRGVFGVPTMEVDGKLFWGFDALPMLRAYLETDPWFATGGAWDTVVSVPTGVSRVRR